MFDSGLAANIRGKAENKNGNVSTSGELNAGVVRVF